jgi:hypothetical protein
VAGGQGFDPGSDKKFSFPEEFYAYFSIPLRMVSCLIIVLLLSPSVLIRG